MQRAVKKGRAAVAIFSPGTPSSIQKKDGTREGERDEGRRIPSEPLVLTGEVDGDFTERRGGEEARVSFLQF